MDIEFWRERALEAGWVQSHIEKLNVKQLKSLLQSAKEYKLDEILNQETNRATIVNLAYTYGLNPQISRTMTLDSVKEFIRKESLYKNENLVYGPTVEGPFYPGPRAVTTINRPTSNLLYTNSSFDLTASDLATINKGIGAAPGTKIEIKKEERLPGTADDLLL